MSHQTHDHLGTSRGHWWLVVVLGAVTIVSGTTGVLRYEHEHGGEEHFLGAVYHAVQMLILHTAHFEHGANGWLELGRWAGAATAFSAAANLFGKRIIREWKRILLSRWSGHVVVCGLGEKGFEIVMCILGGRKAGGWRRAVLAVRRFQRRLEGNEEAGDQCRKRVVVIDPAPEQAMVDECEAAGACVIIGDASNSEVLAEARVRTADEVVVITPSDQTNIRIAAEVRALCRKKGVHPACHVHLSDIHLREMLNQRFGSEGKDAAGRLRFFDVFDSEARRVFRDHPLDGEGIGKNDPRSVHVVIFGFGRMGRSLALRAAKIGHFANGKPLRISVIDRNAAKVGDRFLVRYPMLGGQSICDLKFLPEEAESQRARKWIGDWAAEPETLLHVFICLDDDTRSLEMALRMQGLFRGRAGGGLRVRVRSKHSLASIIEEKEKDKGAGKETKKEQVRIVPFGMVDDTCSDGAFRGGELDAVAQAIHKRFAAQCIAKTDRRPETDPALREWKDLGDDFLESNRQQADHLPVKLRAIGCKIAECGEAGDPVEKLTPAEIDMLAPVEHQRWNAERWLAGWCLGTPGDKLNRISPYLVAWEQLEPKIQKYDLEAVEQIPNLVKQAMCGKKIVRVPAVRV